MSDSFNLERKIYDLYTFDAHYDLEPTRSAGLGDYAGELAEDNQRQLFFLPATVKSSGY